MRFLSRDSAEQPSLRDEAREITRLDIRTFGALDGASRHDNGAQSDLERALRLQRDTAEYAAGLQQQMDILVRAYDGAFARWNAAKETLEQRILEQESLTSAALENAERRDAYVGDLEAEVLEAWSSLEQVQAELDQHAAAVRQAEQTSEYYKNEFNVGNRLAAEREKRLTLAVHEAHQSERAATERAEQAERQAQAALRKCEEHRERADWASGERARLAKCYEDACVQARHIGQALSDLERDLTQALTAKDADIASLKQRCEGLEANLLEHINAAIEQARAESERLSTLMHGVQQGRFWRLKRLTQGLRRIIHR